jgi:hypothetical protein
MMIARQNSYDHGEDDLGVLALGSGSTPSSIGESYETPHRTTIERPDGTALSEEVMTADVAASNKFTNDGPR